LKILLQTTIAAAGIFLFTACANNNSGPTLAQFLGPKDSGVQEAGIKMIPVKTPIGTFKVWTKSIGNSDRVKVLLLHGGPAMTHEYMECFESFLPAQGYEIIEYDQLGSFYSDQPKDSSLWTIERFVDEVEQVRVALNLTKDNFYIIGNSWGSMLAIEYALKYQQHIKGMVIGNMMASIPDYANYNKVLRKEMRPSLVFSEFYTKHLCRLPEWPNSVMRSLQHVNEEIYVMMQGHSEFTVSGRIVNWDRKKDLASIKVPTLTVGAKYDTMDPEHMKWMSTQFPNGQYLYCPNGSHLAMWDDQKVFMDGVINFIKSVDQGKTK
jgi:proline iminopeptidase